MPIILSIHGIDLHFFDPRRNATIERRTIRSCICDRRTWHFLSITINDLGIQFFFNQSGSIFFFRVNYNYFFDVNSKMIDAVVLIAREKKKKVSRDEIERSFYIWKLTSNRAWSPFIIDISYVSVVTMLLTTSKPIYFSASRHDESFNNLDHDASASLWTSWINSQTEKRGRLLP